jgi:flagella basal body P-ring formation protein FlgA
MRRCRCALAALAVLVLGTGGNTCAAQRASIRLMAYAEPAAATYTLGDISAIDSADVLLASALAATRVGVTPRLGYSEAVQRQRITELVERADPQLRGALRWQGAEAVTVRGRGQQFDGQAMIEIAARALVDALDESSTRIDVQPVGALATLRVPAGSLRIAARLPGKSVPSRRMCVWLDVQVDGKDYRSVPVWFAVKALQPALVARVPLRAGATLRAVDFATEFVDVAGLGAAPLPAAAPLEQLRLRQPLDAGRPLLAAHIEQRPAVVRNQAVEVKLVLGSIRLETAGIALGDARLGEVVRVRNPANNEFFGATVIADGKVLIQAR